mmetsp:Transcript_23192/g.65799  ORF Transcript_23192/g.65799 Transcript_23192/m.65799 type:complete len:224 (-) Transcript_23192:61-732(-)
MPLGAQAADLHHDVLERPGLVALGQADGIGAPEAERSALGGANGDHVAWPLVRGQEEHPLALEQARELVERELVLAEVEAAGVAGGLQLAEDRDPLHVDLLAGPLRVLEDEVARNHLVPAGVAVAIRPHAAVLADALACPLAAGGGAGVSVAAGVVGRGREVGGGLRLLLLSTQLHLVQGTGRKALGRSCMARIVGQQGRLQRVQVRRSNGISGRGVSRTSKE